MRVTGDDHARLGEHAERFTHFVGNRCYMRMNDEHCAALVVSAAGEFACSVYEQRPSVCRELERGGPECRAEREQKEARTQALLHVLRHV